MASDAVRNGPVLRRADLYLLATVALWLLWVLASPLSSASTPEVDSPYVVAPLVLLLGVLAGRVSSSLPRAWRIPELVLVGAVMFLVASELYANAQGSVGVQLVALAGLMLLTLLPRLGGTHSAVSLFTVVFGIVVIGVLLAARSTASSLLVVLVALVVASTVGHRDGPPRRLVAALALVVLAVAAAAVAWLGSRGSWPDWLSRAEGLSSARHVLWRDALLLWRSHPITGAGQGTFTESSALASSRPDLASAHSSVLQVGAELGLVGLLLLGLMAGAGVAVAATGSRAATLVAVSSWTALGVHSVIDHLFEFPVVVLTAGVVLGWGGDATTRATSARPGSREASASSR